MTVLGALVFGGLLGLAVLWLLLTAPGNDVEDTWDQSQAQVRSNPASASADAAGSNPWALTQSAQK